MRLFVVLDQEVENAFSSLQRQDMHTATPFSKRPQSLKKIVTRS
jgi:hypothetical protein